MLKSLNKNSYNEIKSLIIIKITKIIKESKISFTEYELNNLAIHLTMAILRINSNNYIPLSKYQTNFDPENKAFITAQKIANNLEQEFKVKLPSSELDLITNYLSVTKATIEESNTALDLLDDDIIEILKITNKKLKAEYNFGFKTSQKMYIAIGLHLIPAIERLLANNQITDNPLINQIKERHPDSFNYARVLNDTIHQKYGKSFNDDELGYIALHFAVSGAHYTN